MRARTLVLLGIGLAVLLVGAMALPLAASGMGGGEGAEAGENATVQVTASAEVTGPPDRGVVRPAVVATGDTAEAARAQVATDVERMRTALRDIGVEDDQVRTVHVDIRPITERDGEQTEIVGYRATHAFEVEIDATDGDLGNRTGAIVDTVVANGANQLQGVQFTLSDERRQDLRERALSQAMEDARAEAEHLADLGDLTITGVGSISTGNGGYVPHDVHLPESAAADDGAGTVVEPGPVTVSASVTVTYRAESGTAP